MRNWIEKVMLSVVTFLMSYCFIVLPAQAAAKDFLPGNGMIKGYCYHIDDTSERVYVYWDEKCENRSEDEYISARWDECYIIETSENFNTVRVSYPVPGGERKKRWVKTKSFFAGGIARKKRASASIPTYKFGSSAYPYGTINSGDQVYIYNEIHKGYARVIYPLNGGGYKIAWITMADAQKYLNSGVEIAAGNYTIASAINTSMVMDVYGGRSENGTNIQLYQAHGGNSQEFRIAKAGDGWYTIRNVQSNKAVDVSGGVSRSQTNVWLYEYNGSDAQLWRFYASGDGYYYIQNKLGYYLDVAGGIAKNETNLWVYSLNGTNAQKWKLSKVPSIDWWLDVRLGGRPEERLVGTPKTSTYYVSQTTGAVLRASASTSGLKLTTIPYAAKVSVKAVSNGWAYLSYNGKSGYVLKSSLSLTKPNISSTALVKARLDQIIKGSLSYNAKTVMKTGKKFSGYRSNELGKGYAKNVFYLCFKVTAGGTLAKPRNYLLSGKSGMSRVGAVTKMTVGNVAALLKKARPGDFMQMRRRKEGGSQSAIVYFVDSSGVKLLEANADGRNTITLRYYKWNALYTKYAAMSLYTASNYKLR